MTTQEDMAGDLKAWLDAATKNYKLRERKAERIVWWTILFNSLVGATPLTNWICICANAAMITAVGRVYGFTTGREQIAALLRQVIIAILITSSATFILFLFVIEVMHGGSVTEEGMAVTGLLGAVLSGGITFAIGYTAKTYFARGCTMDREVMQRAFRARFAERGSSSYTTQPES